MRRNPSTTLLIRTCKTHKQLELANLLSHRCLNQNSKLRGRNKLLARLSREKTHVLLLPHSSRDKQRALPLESWRKYVQPWSGTLRQLAQEEHRTRINARAKIDQQHKRRTRKELTFTRTHRNNKLTQGNTLARELLSQNQGGGKTQLVWKKTSGEGIEVETTKIERLCTGLRDPVAKLALRGSCANPLGRSEK
jgi:hypothetical protein